MDAVDHTLKNLVKNYGNWEKKSNKNTCFKNVTELLWIANNEPWYQILRRNEYNNLRKLVKGQPLHQKKAFKDLCRVATLGFMVNVIERILRNQRKGFLHAASRHTKRDWYSSQAMGHAKNYQTI